MAFIWIFEEKKLINSRSIATIANPTTPPEALPEISPITVSPATTPASKELRKINPEKIGAFIVGIDKYKIHEWRLHKCVTDAVNFRLFLKSIYNIPGKNIHVAYNAEATKFNILRELDWLTNEFEYGVFYFSGHGFRVRANDGPGDYYAEGIVHAEHSWSRAGMLLDLDIKSRIQKMKICIVVVDACHSAGIARGVGEHTIRPKAISPPKQGVRMGPDFFKGLKSISKEISTREIWELAACMSHQQAYELHNGGAFTTNLINTLTQTPEITMFDLQEKLRSQITTNQTPVITAPSNNLPLFYVAQ